jgi:hypothetical protein
MPISLQYLMYRTTWNICTCTTGQHGTCYSSPEDLQQAFIFWWLLFAPDSRSHGDEEYVPAEQNHSSICAHLGRGANWSIVEHCSQLIMRQPHFCPINFVRCTIISIFFLRDISLPLLSAKGKKLMNLQRKVCLIGLTPTFFSITSRMPGSYRVSSHPGQ